MRNSAVSSTRKALQISNTEFGGDHRRLDLETAIEEVLKPVASPPVGATTSTRKTEIPAVARKTLILHALLKALSLN
jgi:hypothetical protein